MKRLIVKIRKDDQSDPELYEVPGEQPAATLVPNLVKVLNLPPKDTNGVPLEYWLESASGRLIRDADTLAGAGIRNDTVLLVRSGADKPAEVSLQIAAGRKPVLPSADRVEAEPGKGPVKGFRRLRVPDQVVGDTQPSEKWKRIGS